MDFKRIEGSQDRDVWRAVVIVVMNPWIP